MWVWGVDIRGIIFLVWAWQCVAVGIWRSKSPKLKRTKNRGLNQ